MSAKTTALRKTLRMAAGLAIGIVSALFLFIGGAIFYFEMSVDATFFDFVGFDRFTLQVALSQPSLWVAIVMTTLSTLGLTAAYDILKGNRLFYWMRKP